MEDSSNPTDISNINLETRVKQTIDQALVSEKLVDIFDAAGIQKPDISILSDEFMQEMRDYEHQNIALEMLKKLLNDEIKIREQHSVTQGKKLMDMLDSAIKGYQNKVLTAAEVIDELIKLAKQIKDSDHLAQELKLTDFEYTFYSAVAKKPDMELLATELVLNQAEMIADELAKHA